MKALVAASQCPHCGHLLDLRDSFGELLPLTHCPTCACDYPTREGMCKWCGTSPAPRRIDASTLWKGVGVLAFVGLAVGVWATRDAAPDLVARQPAPNDSVADARIVAPVVGDTPVLVAAHPVQPRTDSSVGPAPPAVIESSDVAPPTAVSVAGETSPPSEPTRTEATTEVDPAPVTVTPTPARGPMPTPARVAPRTAKRPGPVRWRSVVARNWVTVRAAPRHGSRLLGSLGPDTRLQLGESREGWVRVRMQGLSGWVHEARLSTRAIRTRTLARR